MKKRHAGLLVGLTATGLAVGGFAAPAMAAPGVVTVIQAGVVPGQGATLYCQDPTGATGSWDDEDSTRADASGVLTFVTNTGGSGTWAIPGATCTVYFNTVTGPTDPVTHVAPVVFPGQTLGGEIGTPDSVSVYGSPMIATFALDAAGNFTVSGFSLITSAAIAGTVVPAPIDTSTTVVRLHRVFDSTVTLVRETRVTAANNPLQGTGTFVFGNLTPNAVYFVEVRSPGYVNTWYGGATGELDPYDPAFAGVVAPAGGQTAQIPAITLAQAGTSINGILTGFSARTIVGAWNPLTGKAYVGTVTAATSSYTIPGLSEGVWVVEAVDSRARYAYAILDVTGPGVVHNLAAAQLPSRELGLTSTAISGMPEANAVVTAQSTTFGAGYGIVPAYAYTWISGNKIIGTEASLTVPAAVGTDLYVLTTVAPAGLAPVFTVTSAYGKITKQKAPIFNFKVKGTLKVGKKVGVVVPKAAKGFKLTYQWYAGGKKIAGKAAKKATFKLTSKQAGKTISVQVVYKKDGFTNGKVKSAKTAKVAK
ncbi:MAG: hypothetical protein LBJ08_01235 [Bifidobacteriaceae bacterium]|jgi:hypothetical protein|nr:hypothetical protein [Bifidobacteriaceae bacterium]